MKILFVVAVLLAAITLPLLLFYLGERRTARFKRYLGANILSFVSALILCTVFVFSGNASAAEAAEVVSSSAGISSGLAYLGAALSTGLGSIGAGVATGQAASAALGALSENDSIMGKALIFVALAEGIAIYGLIISVMILSYV